jgi:hypothetical protein
MNKLLDRVLVSIEEIEPVGVIPTTTRQTMLIAERET